MPGGTARSADADGPGLFTGPVLQWLHDAGCRAVLPVPAVDDVAPAWITAPAGPHGSDASGWRFGFRDRDGVPHALLLVFADRDAFAAAPRAALADYLALAGECAVAAGVADGPAGLIDRDDVGRRIHDLRNGLNSLLMNAAVLTMKLPEAERGGRFAVQVQADGERCAALLQSLAESLRPADAPLAR